MILSAEIKAIFFGVPVHFSLFFFSLIYEDLRNIHTTKTADYIITEHCRSNHLMPIIALLRIPP